MSIRRVVPDIASKDMDASRQFYTALLGLTVAMDMGFVVTLVSPANPTAQVTLIRDDGAAAIQPNMSIEVSDVDEVHDRAVAQGREIVYPLTDEPWGIRRFFVIDPSGVVINVLSHGPRDITAASPRKPSSTLVRLATSADAAAIARIHNQGIEERVGTFETAPRTTEQVRASIVENGEQFPTIVVECEGLVVAWAAAGPYRSRPCYAGVAEHSVYVDRSARRAGFGRAALNEFLRVYERLGFWKIVSRIFPENVSSLGLHEQVGFRVVGTYKRHGRLDGEWRDCVIVEKLLGEAAQD